MTKAPHISRGFFGRPRRAVPLVFWVLLGLTLSRPTVRAGDILRGGAPATAPGAASTGSTGATGTATTPLPSSADRLARTTQALEAVKQMQTAARNLAIAGPNNLKTSLPAVPVNSYGLTNGLVPATGVPKDLLKPGLGEDATLWAGAKLPTVKTETTTSGTTTTTTSTVTIQQTQQQAILNWQSFNIGKNTTVAFDQSAGGADVGQWIAFNKVGVTGNPSQILGTIKADGQVYVINPNGIIFGGSSQVNTHALVASSLPINDNLIQRGLLNNPDTQFVFSALPQAAGVNGTPLFTPRMADQLTPSGNTGGNTTTSVMKVASLDSLALTYLSDTTGRTTLAATTDYTASKDATTGKVTVVLTPAGLAKTTGQAVNISYTPLGDQYGSVEVQAGAQLTAPTNADHVGGKVALLGTNVTNAGTISTADGQTILAAGLQVGLTPHLSTDPTLRGLDVFVGAVADPASNLLTPVGAVTNDRITNSTSSVYTGLISAPRGAVTMTGQTVNQLGFIDSSTSVAYNGRVDLVAGYNAVANPNYNAALSNPADFTLSLPFFYQSHVGNDVISGEPVPNSGLVTLGKNSVLRIMPETASSDRVAGDLALLSQVNIQGQSAYLAADSTLLAPGAAVPLNKAFAFDGRALEAGVNIRAGQWFNPRNANYNFVHADDTQQIYVEKGASIDVAGLTNVAASVAENIVAVELRGSELANSPLQRDGPLRGQTIQVDVRQHGDWDPTLNSGLGGYAWVGTPLANTAGWVGLATHSVGQLTVNGGSVSLKAGGPVILQKGSVVDVSGGSINYEGGEVKTTKLSGADGHIYDIAKATPDVTYLGIYSGTTSTTDPKWGVTATSTNPLAMGITEPGYLQGGRGGSVAIVAPVVALDGTLQGKIVAGPGQRKLSPAYDPATPPDPANPKAVGVARWLLDALSRPVPSGFSLKIGRQQLTGAGNYVGYSPTPANITFRTGSTLAPAEAYRSTADYLFPAQRNYQLDLDPALASGTGAGFGLFRVDNSEDDVGASPGYGNITVKAGTSLNLSPSGSLALAAGNIAVEPGASVTASGGRLSFNAFDISPSQADAISFRLIQPNTTVLATPYEPLRGNVAIGSGAVLNTAGDLVDERSTSATAGTLPLVTGGGGIIIKANDLTLKAGSRLTVAGGALISTAGKYTYGDAGSIILNAGKALPVPNEFGTVLGGRLSITGAVLEGYTGLGNKGGALDLQSTSILIKALTGTATTATDALTGGLTLAPGFFAGGGFASYAVTGLGIAVDATGSMTGPKTAFSIASGTTIPATVQNWETLPAGAVFLAPEGVRKAASLSFRTSGQFVDVNGALLNNNVDLVLGSLAVLSTDAGGSIALSGGSIDLLGRITARGGAISLSQSKGVGPFTPGIHLGPAAGLDVSGSAVFSQDLTGYYKSDVLAGGNISITGNLAAETGASLDVSGGTDTVLLAPGIAATELTTGAAMVKVPVVKDSNGGSITIRAEQLLFSAASLRGMAGGRTGQGGSLNLFSNRASTVDYADGSGQFQPTDPAFTLRATAPAFVYRGLGQPVTDSKFVPLGDAKGLGLVQFGADSFSAGGFGVLAITAGTGTFQVQGNVSLTASRQIALADGGLLALVGDPKTPVSTRHSFSVAAPYVSLGMPFLEPVPASAAVNPFGRNIAATNGTGLLTVQAGSLIDVGTLSLQNVGTVLLDATQGGTTAGTIRGNGTLDLAGAITLKAGQIYPPTAVTFNIIANDYSANSAVVPGSVTIQNAGTGGTPALPLSAGGTLNISASNITQGGVLRAPLGTINLGVAAGSGTNPLSGQSLPVASKLTLQPGSTTSVSALDPGTGKPVKIPYGLTVNGSAWIDPTGTDITNIGPNAKAVTFSAASIDFQAATTTAAAADINLAGGGDLFAYQFVPGVGGTTDLLLGGTSGSFAILPAFPDSVAPYAPYNRGTDAQSTLGQDPGYVVGNARLNYTVGDHIHLEAGSGLAAGNYTLLPARYALLPGAFLVTPRTGPAFSGEANAVTQPDRSVVVAGYRFNGLDANGQTQSIFRSFEITPQSVVLKRAQYDNSTANDFFAAVATRNDKVSPRLPVDAGSLQVAAGLALRLGGKVNAQAATGGRGGLADISSTADILIGSKSVIASKTASGSTGTLLLDATELDAFGSDSLLVGGVRTPGTNGTVVKVTTNRLTVDNAGQSLNGADIILVANKSLTLAANSEIAQTRLLSAPAESLLLKDAVELAATSGNNVLTLARGGGPVEFPSGLPAGDSLLPSSSGTITKADGTTTVFAANTSITTLGAGSRLTLDAGGTLTTSFNAAQDPVPLILGDGLVVRVSSDPAAGIVREAVASSTAPQLTVGAGTKIAAASILLDSTYATSFDPTAKLTGKSLTLDSGQISLKLGNGGRLLPTVGLVLPETTLQVLLAGAQSLSLLSYNSLDIYGTGKIGGLDAAGKPVLASLGLHAGEIRGFSSAGGGGNVTFAAQSILLDNAAQGVVPGTTQTPFGSLVFDAGAGPITVGENRLAIDQFANVTFKTAGGLLLQDQGGLAVQSGLTIATPLVSGATGARQSIAAGGGLKIEAWGSTPAIAATGLGAQLSLSGSSVEINSNVTLRSGVLTIQAKSDDLQVGNLASSRLDVSGTAQHFYEVTKYTDAGRIDLTAASGSVNVGKYATVDVSAQAAGGRAGSLSISAPNGAFTLAETGRLQGQGGTDRQGGPEGSLGGTFTLDVSKFSSSATLDAALNLNATADTGGFVLSRSLRVRTGDVAIDGPATAHAYSVFADQGAITVAEKGSINAAGAATDASGAAVDVAAKLAAGTWTTDGTGRVLDAAGKTVALQGGTGGKITLAAAGSVTLQNGAALTVAGTYTDAAGKGGAVSLEAGSTQNGVAPSRADTRNPLTGAFLLADTRDPLTQAILTKGTPVVDLQKGSTIDLSIAASTVALAAGQKYVVPRASVTGDLLSADVGGTITKTDGSTVTFAQGILPTLEAGSSLTLNAAGKLTYLADGANGTATGTLHLRAPQTTVASTSAPDVQINPINGTLLNPSSIVVEGYKTYTPVAGFIDSVEVDIDLNGRSFASGTNTNKIISNLTANWGTGTGQVNGTLSKLAGSQLHVQPGAEIIGSTVATVSTITYPAPGSTSTLAIPAGATLTLPSTTNPLLGASTNDLLFSSATTLKATDNGIYKNTVSTIGPVASTTLLPVLADTSIKVGTSAVTAGKLTSTVGGKITPLTGTATTFVAGPLPALPASSTITFTGAGTLASATSTNVTGLALTVQNSFKAGVSINLPASSTVTLSTNGGTVTYKTAGSLTWNTRQVATNSFAVQLPADGSLFTPGAGGTLLASSGGSGTVLSLLKTTAANLTTSGGALTLSAGGSLLLPNGTFTRDNTSTVAANANTLQIGSATTSTLPFTVTIKSAGGATIKFPNTVIGSVTTQKGGTQSLAKTTLDTTGVALDAGGTLVFGSATQISSTVPGIITLPLQILDSTGISVPAPGGTITIPAGTGLAAGALTATVGGRISAPDGTVQTFAAGTILTAVPDGSIVSIAGGKLALATTTATAIAVPVTNNLAAGTPTSIIVDSVIKFTSGGRIATTSGTVSGLAITNYLLPGKAVTVARNDVIQLAGAADVATVNSNSAFSLSGNNTVTLSLASSNPTASKITFLNGTSGSAGPGILAAVQAGSYTPTGPTVVSSPTPGDLTLANVWDLSTFRYGPNVDIGKPGSGEPGILTIRTPGNLVFNYAGYNTGTKVLAAGSLSDGFGPIPAADGGGLWRAPILAVGAQSWSYQLTAGADLAAGDVRQVLPLAGTGSATGSILLGQGSGTLPTTTGTAVTNSSVIPRFYQTIRTGTGNIAIAAGRDVQFLNPLATIYTAGRQAAPLGGFDVPVLNSDIDPVNTIKPYYALAQFTMGGGDVSIQAQNDIARYVLSGTALIANSSKEMPSNWLYRRGNLGSDGRFEALSGAGAPTTEVQSTSWWIDFSNFFSDVGALGGGNVSLTAGRNVSNINAAAATNARMPGKDAAGLALAPDATKLVELGGGNVTVRAGADIDGGVYYVERGKAVLSAAGEVKTNPTRAAFNSSNVNPVRWLPTTFFLGKGSIDVSTGGNVRLGAVANPFWQPQGAGNRLYEVSYFTTDDPGNSVSISSLNGTISLQVRPDYDSAASLTAWYSNVLSVDTAAAAAAQPWLKLGPKDSGGRTPARAFQTVASVLPGNFNATAFADDIEIVGTMTLGPSPSGALNLLSAGNIRGLAVNGANASTPVWGSAVINLSDADPIRLPGVTTPISDYTPYTLFTVLERVNALFAEAGGASFGLDEKLSLHGQVPVTNGLGATTNVPLHYNDPEPLRLYAKGGDLSGLTLYSAKSSRVLAKDNLSDIAFYVQNTRATDNTLIAAGRDIVAYAPDSPWRLAAQEAGNLLPATAGSTGPASGNATAGDIQIAGPGALQVLAGRNLDLGNGSSAKKDGSAVGITSVGATRNPYLPQNSGADIITVAGLGNFYTSAAAVASLPPGLATTNLGFPTFIGKFLNPTTAGAQAERYLPELGIVMGLTTKDTTAIWTAFGYSPGVPLTEQQATEVLDIYQLVLRNSARDRNKVDSPNFGKYTDGFDAIAALFPGSPQPTEAELHSSDPVVRPPGPWSGDLSMSTRLIKTFEGGNITLLVPGGDITVGRATDPQKPDQGVLTERSGNIAMYAADSVNVGTSRIFTLRGGNEILWSTWGNIAAGSGSKTVFSAPPTRVLVDPQSADVKNDLAGLATGSGIGVLATLSGVKPGDVDLIAPVGTIDAGDAGIRSSGNLNLAARVVLNASNIQVGGSSAGAPPPPPAPNLGSLSAASTASAGASSAATEVAKQSGGPAQTTVLPSLISVEVLGYGGGDEDEEEKKKREAAAAAPST